MAEPNCPMCKKVLKGDEETWCWTDTPYLAFCGIQCHDNYRHVVLVMGGRDFDDVAVIDRVLSVVHERQPITLLAHGGGSGADSLCDSWAKKRKIPVKAYGADCAKYGEAAWSRAIRNTEMLKEKPDLVVAFSGGKTTSDMVKKCQLMLLPIIFV